MTGSIYDEKRREFRMTIPVSTSESDINGLVRMSAIQGYIITAATRHLETVGASSDEVYRRAGAFWVLIRMRCELSAPLRCKGELEIATWGADPHSAGFQREAEIYRDGELVGRAVSLWCLASAENRKIMRPSVLDGVIDLKTAGAPRFPTPGRLLRPERSGEPYLHTVRYSDIDMNGHLHSARYTDICCDALTLERGGLYAGACQINYHAECRAGDRLSLYSGTHEDESLICGIGGDGKIRFDASFILREI